MFTYLFARDLCLHAIATRQVEPHVLQTCTDGASQQTRSNKVCTCPLTKFEGGLQSLH